MTYRAPIDEILFTMSHAAGLQTGLENGLYPDLADDFARTLLGEAAKFAENILNPINRSGDQHGTVLRDGFVSTAPGWRDAYSQWRDSAWSSVVASPDFGGMGLPHLLNSGCLEMWTSANMAFTLGPLLSFGAIDALVAHGSDELKKLWLAQIVSGQWTATMNLTEPQAGSDLNALRTKAVRSADGTYKITGQKIFITYGDHDLTDNIVHLVLARLPDAPVGTRGISLFLVPKFLLNSDGSIGKRNDVRCTGLEHKLGIHGSPTCSMSFGDDGGATGWLIGQENRGLACMFTMMNNARLGVGLQGVALAERAFQHALSYASERRQGRTPCWSGDGMAPIIYHPDIRRMLMTMKTKTQAARAICYMTANAIDEAHRLEDRNARQCANERASLLTPVAKAFSTDIGNEVASLGVQVHGGMGFIEEAGAAQFLRDVRIAAIYEGTNGIQAIDLVTRKLPLAGGETVKREIGRMRASLEELRRVNSANFGSTVEALSSAVDCLERSTSWLMNEGVQTAAALAGASPYLRLFGLACGGVALSDMAIAALEAPGADQGGRNYLASARFFAENIAVESGALETAIVSGGESIPAAEMFLGEPA